MGCQEFDLPCFLLVKSISGEDPKIQDFDLLKKQITNDP